MTKITDKRISAIHITLLVVLNNLSEFMHKFYIFHIVDMFGIFLPQAILSSLAILMLVFFGSSFRSLNDLPISSWHLSDEVIKKKITYELKRKIHSMFRKNKKK